MTDKVNPSVNREADPFLTAAAIRYAGGADPGWIAATDTEYFASDQGLSNTPLNAFNYTSNSGLTVTIDTGEGFIGGAWLARDTTTDVDLSASTNGQEVYAGWDKSASDTVIVGTSSAFASADPKLHIWTFDTNSTGVTNSTDQRPIGPDRGTFSGVNTTYDADEDGVVDNSEKLEGNTLGDVRSHTPNAHASRHAQGGSDELDAADLSGADGSAGNFLKTNGSDAHWAAGPEPWVHIDTLKDSDTSTALVLDTGTLSRTYDQYRIYLYWENHTGSNNEVYVRINGIATSDYETAHANYKDGTLGTNFASRWTHIANTQDGQPGSGEIILTNPDPEISALQNQWPQMGCDIESGPERAQANHGELQTDVAGIDRIKIFTVDSGGVGTARVDGRDITPLS